jgi:hypothetical protein
MKITTSNPPVDTREPTLRRRGRSAAAALAIAAFVPAMAMAQTAQSGPQPGPWRYSFSVNGYLPSISGSTSFPTDGGEPINVTAEQILDRLKMTFMGTFEAHNGAWGVFTDLVYVDLGNTKSSSREFTIGNIGLPVGTTADLDWDYKSTIWTLAGVYRVASQPSMTVDLLAGARLWDQRERLRWSITGDLGPLPPASRTGSSSIKESVWDGIVGVKARYVFGSNREWAVPLYLDVGAGQSDLTVQAAGGISYAFQWGELSALYRYVGYEPKAGKPVSDVNFSGPQIGAVFRW